MILQFICADHRKWISANNQRAEQYCEQWQLAATEYSEQGNIRQSIPFWGCAFELAEILLEQRWPDAATAQTRFSFIAARLCRGYEEISEPESADYLRIESSKRLAQDLAALVCDDSGQAEPRASGVRFSSHVVECMQRLHSASCWRGAGLTGTVLLH